jgi:hypothetical protein
MGHGRHQLLFLKEHARFQTADGLWMEGVGRSERSILDGTDLAVGPPRMRVGDYSLLRAPQWICFAIKGHWKLPGSARLSVLRVFDMRYFANRFGTACAFARPVLLTFAFMIIAILPAPALPKSPVRRGSPQARKPPALPFLNETPALSVAVRDPIIASIIDPR